MTTLVHLVSISELLGSPAYTAISLDRSSHILMKNMDEERLIVEVG